jgi:cell wall-associated NlpC family hydrolase
MPQGRHQVITAMDRSPHRSLCRSLGAAIALASVVVGLLAAQATVAQAGEPISEQGEVTSGATSALNALAKWSDDGDTSAYLAYLEARDHVAATVAETLGLNASEMVEAWSSSDLDGQTAVLAALGQLGVPYRRYASAPGEAFDCSGLTRFAWGEAGVELERSSRNQFRSGVEIDRDAARAGDLVWYPGHVMLYLGVGNAIVHSPTRGRTVEYQILSDRRAGWVRFADPTAAP